MSLAVLASGACQLDRLLSSGERTQGTSVTARRLVFTVQPGSATTKEPIVPAVEVTAQDGAGRVDPAFTGQITLSLASNPGGATLSGTTSRNATTGVARFNDLTIDKAGQGYTLRASATGLTSANSAPFNQPTNVTVGAVITPAVTVTIRDRSGNIATSYASAVSIDIAPGSGTPTARLSGTLTRTPSAGVATFDDLRINLPGLNYRLRVTTGNTEATSATFNVQL